MSTLALAASVALVLAALGAYLLFDTRRRLPIRRRLFGPYMILSALVTTAWFATMGFGWPMVTIGAILALVTAWALIRGARACPACTAVTISRDLLRPSMACRVCGASLVQSATHNV